MDMTPNPPAELAEPPSAPAATAQPVHVPALPEAQLPEPKGCLYAISQPPLMFFLTFIAVLLAITGVHDLFLN
ncbi:hypothetical protein [Streptomyces marispadix]|uniref:Uncharacterized protein n=1 Tax=Streptomyces marispadix TaxID=2922868 RepID=A0ABS9ST42_9ACTN|nr:hypothetical protein [Streptomyces marispadix]MCH6159216.1 hypothetical protein [Streptomyces marispadix]